jgi:hypothetical protein
MAAKHVKTILDNTAELRNLTDQSRRLQRLQHRLRASLPADIATLVSVGELASGRLTIHTPSGAAAAKIRQLTPRLLKALRRGEPELNAFKIMVQVSRHHNPLPKKQIFLGHTAGRELLTLADRLADSPLRLALRQLASRAVSSDNKQETLEEINAYKNQYDNQADS